MDPPLRWMFAAPGRTNESASLFRGAYPSCPGGPMASPHPPIDPEGKRLPIKLDSTSNGEFVPVPLSATNRLANRLAHEYASGHSKKLGITRRSFLVSACGAASTLLAFNAANAAAGKTGGYFEL